MAETPKDSVLGIVQRIRAGELSPDDTYCVTGHSLVQIVATIEALTTRAHDGRSLHEQQ